MSDGEPEPEPEMEPEEEPEPEPEPEVRVDRTAVKDLRIRDFVAQTITYTTNDTKEKLVLEYVEHFEKQFKALHPTRRPLLLCPRNECGVQKFICTTIRPTKLPYKDVYNFAGCAKFVSEYLVQEPLSDPIEHPTHAPSPHSVFMWQRGDSLDMAIALCSLLLGVGYDAYCVSGYAPEFLTTGDQQATEYSQCVEELEKHTADADSNPEGGAQSPRSTRGGGKEDGAKRGSKFDKTYKIVKAPPLESAYETAQLQKRAAEEAARLAAAAQGPVEGEKEPLHGMRVHYWVLLRVGKRQVNQPLFLEPVSGRVYSTTDSPFLGVESVWNNKNYFVNMQDADLPMAKYSWNKLENVTLWEYIFFEADGRGMGADLELGDSMMGLGMDGSMDREGSPDLDGGDGGAGAEEEILEVPPSWCRRIEITQDEFDNRSLGGGKALDYARCKMEIFAEYKRTDGLVSRLTLYADDERTQPIEIREKLARRADCLVERVTNVESGAMHERFVRGHRDHSTGGAAYGGAQGRMTGLKSVFLDADHRELCFFPGARLDGLVHRVRTFGVKVHEVFEGRDDHLIYRSVSFDSEAMEPEDLRACKGRLISQYHSEGKVRKMAEKYARDESIQVEQDVAKRTYKLGAAPTVRLDYHHEPGRITRKTRIFSKAHERCVNPLAPAPKRPEYTVEYDDFVKAPKVLWEQEKECLVAAREAETEAMEILKGRSLDEEAITLERDLRDVIHRTIAEGTGDSGADDKKDLIEERDYLKPYLPAEHEPHDMSARLSKEQAIQVKDQCLKAHKERLVERANIIQSRLDNENASLAREQSKFTRTREHATPEAINEYEDNCADAWFRIQILEQRLSRHEDNALYKFAELDTRLRNDPRLSSLHEY